MAIKHPENFVTFGAISVDKETVSTRLANLNKALGQGADSAATSISPEAATNYLKVRRKANQLIALLEQANTDFQAQRYDAALDNYRKASKKVLALMEPEIEWHTLPDEWPSGSSLVDATMHTSADLISQMAPEKEELPAVVSVDETIGETLGGPSRPRITYAQTAERTTKKILDRASAATQQGRWQEAASFYQQALESVSDREKRADILLNLGAMNVQMGQSEEAQAHLEEAKEIFKETGNQTGAAQASHNTGLAHLKSGNREGAISSLKEARDLAGEAGLFGLLQPESNNGSGDNGAPVPPVPPVPPFNPGDGSNRPTLPDMSALENVTPIPSTLPQGLDLRVNVPLQPQIDQMKALGSQDMTLRLRPVREGTSVSNVKLKTPAQEQQESSKRTLLLPTGGEVARLTWSEDQRLQPEALLEALQGRTDADTVDDINVSLDTPSAVLANLSHLYHLVLPVKMGDCHHELGNYQKAEKEYRRAADYELVNTSLEGAELWRRLAENTVKWGDTLYRRGDAEAAASVYERLTTPQGEAADTFLYETDSLKATGERVDRWLQAVEADEPPPDLNPAVAQILQTVRRRWSQLNAGLDFFGNDRSVVPPFTFGYLQEVARYFANRAIQTEKRLINFYNRFERGQQTHRQLENAVEQAKANEDAAQQKKKVAQKSAAAAKESANLAQTRHENAKQRLEQFDQVDERLEYLASTKALASVLRNGEHPTLQVKGEVVTRPDVSTPDAMKLLTAEQKRISNKLQKKRMQDTVDRTEGAIDVAKKRKEAAEARHEAAKVEHQAAKQRVAHTEEMLKAFEEQRFTPNQWGRMAALMQSLADEALDRAVEVARLTQRAYNFEQLDDRDAIRNSYDIGRTDGLLGGEVLLSDINSFTFDRVSTVESKPNQVKWSISLSEQYPAQFLEFRRTGRMEFELDPEQIRLAHPGTYRHQLAAVEVEAIGFVPPEGLHGRLTNTGIGRIRDESGGTRYRIQPSETMVLSRYDRSRDAIVLSPPEEMRGLFEDNALASGWTLVIPPSANDVNLDSIFDIQLVLYFECLYDHQLFQKDTEFEANQSGVDYERSRPFFLRQQFPDAYYQLREDGAATIELTANDFPHNETEPTIQSLALAFDSSDNSSLQGTTVQVGYPGLSDTVEVTVSEDELVDSPDLPVEGEPSALGTYTVEIADEQTDRRERVEDLVLVMDYRFTPAGS